MLFIRPHLIRRAVVHARQWLRSSEAAFVVLATIVGAAAGVATVAQGWLAHSLQHMFYGVTINRLSALGSIRHFWKLLALPAGGLALALIDRVVARRRRAPIDVVEANALHGGRIPASDNVVIAAQTIVSNGCGASVGLEATYAQVGGGIASLLGQWLSLRREDLRTLVGAGAGAAVGTAFGAPLTGAFYAFEIVIGTYTSAYVAPVIAASLTSSVVMRLLGVEPYLLATVSGSFTLLDYLAYAVLGVVCAGLGIVIMRLVTLAERWAQRVPVPHRWRPVAGGVLLMPLALVSPQTLSAGHGALHIDLMLHPSLTFLLVVLVLKIAASVISLASGFRGGLFFASLFLGSLIGQAYGLAFNLNPWGLALVPTDAALVGMAALSVAIVGGPMTLAMLMLETTHNFALMAVVLTASLLSTAVTREVFGYSFSTWRLHVRGSAIKGPRDIGWMLSLTAARMMRRDWKSVPVAATVTEFRVAVPIGSTSKAILVGEDGAYHGIVPTAAAYAPDLDPHRPVSELATLRKTMLLPEVGIKEVLAVFKTSMADELAIVDKDGKVVGVVSENFVRRRYLEEIESAQARMFGE
ncbi:chloride channel protein [Novosphingobium colocasiae]|uniref:Chloride channel protein n=1 Tax=Novosphingobium colocasiae TaxID=1256513 RepID=A0A918PDC5_9SPHN|nr:chloride channel protein [Novosphingobium colocasiae]GGZ01425.1 chloride channel protein [Novosphingobium colocasiae]